MKKIMIGMVMMIGMSAYMYASDFSFIDVKQPQVSAGKFYSLDGGSDGGWLLSIILHKNIPQENMLSALITGWTPLEAGMSLGRGLGGPSVSVGTSLNLMPLAQTGLLKFLDSITSPDSLSGLKSDLKINSDNAVNLVGGFNYAMIYNSDNKTVKLKPLVFLGLTVNFK